jgi:hypothetical protein
VRHVLLVATLLIGLVACEPPRESTPQRPDRAVDTVRGPELPADEREIRIDSTVVVVDEAGLPMPFEGVRSAQWVSRRLIVIDRQARQELSVITRSGGGWGRTRAAGLPAESRLDGVVPVSDDGDILLWDRRRDELWSYDSSGLTFAAELGISGRIVASGDTIWVRSRPVGASGSLTFSPTLSAFSASGELLEDVQLPPVRREQHTFSASSPQGLLPNFVRVTESILVPGVGLARIRNASYEITIDRGDESRHIIASTPTIPLLEAERTWWNDLARRISGWSGEPAAVPDTKPAFKAVFADHHQRLWVWRHVEAIPIDSILGHRPPNSMPYVEIPTFDVFDVDGTYIGTIRLPVRSRIMDIVHEGVLIAETFGRDQEVLKLLHFTKPAVGDGASTRTLRPAHDASAFHSSRTPERSRTVVSSPERDHPIHRVGRS